MICSQCGTEASRKALNCGVCGYTISHPVAAVAYAGFWRRVASTAIDVGVLIPHALIFTVLTLGPRPSLPDKLTTQQLGAGQTVSQADERQVATSMMKATMYYFAIGASVFILGWPYFALMERSRAQGTIGKIILGIKVTDLGFGKIGIGRASLRYWARLLSALPAQGGFLLPAFSQKKQALHDMLAGCVVIRD